MRLACPYNAEQCHAADRLTRRSKLLTQFAGRLKRRLMASVRAHNEYACERQSTYAMNLLWPAILMLLLAQHVNAECPSVPQSWIEHKVVGGLSIRTPANWNEGEHGAADSLWIALPSFTGEGNLVLRRRPTVGRLDLRTETPETFRQGFLSSGLGRFYKDFHVFSFDNTLHISRNPALYLTYVGFSAANTVSRGSFMLVAMDGALLTIHSEFTSLTPEAASILPCLQSHARSGYRCTRDEPMQF